MANTTKKEKAIKELFIGKCWKYLDDNFHKFDSKDKLKIALELCKKNVPQEIEASVKEIKRMPSVKVNGETFIPIIGQIAKEEDDTVTEDASNATEADTTTDKD